MTESIKEYLFEIGSYFKSCHASSVLRLDDGTVLCAYFAGTAEKNPDVGIWLSRRTENGWQPPVQISKTEQTAHWNPVLFKTKNAVRIVYKVGDEICNWKTRIKVSYDKGLTWSDEKSINSDNVAGGPVRSKPIYLSNGLLLAPNSDETVDRWTVRVDVSDNFGETFYRYGTIPLNMSNPEEPTYISAGANRVQGAIQPTLWESRPGHVHAMLRTTCGCIFRSDSYDYGRTWSLAYDTGLPNNNSAIDVALNGKELYLVSNPVRGDSAPRTPLTIQKSTDNGITFTHFITLEDELYDEEFKWEEDSKENLNQSKKLAEFSYPSIVIKNGVIYVTYTHNRKRIAFQRITIE